MRNDVWLHGRAGRGPKMDVVENKRENETLTETDVKQTKHTHYVQDKAAKVVTGCNGPVCAQHGCEDDVVGTAMTSTEMDDDLHRSEKKRGGNMGGHLSSRKPGVVGGACRARNIMTRLVEV